MSALTTVVWGMALGAIAAVALARLGDLLVRPSASQLRAAGFHLSVFLLVLVESGILRQATQAGAARLHVLQVLAGPMCVGVSMFWIHGWLAASRRDRLMAAVLRVASLALPLLGAATLALPRHAQLPAAAVLSLAGGGLTCWLTFRAWWIGDRLALVMALGCLLTLPAIAGLYALAMHLWRWTPGMQAALAFAAALSNGLTGAVLWRRERHEWSTRDTGSVPTVDPVTRVHSSSALVHRLVQAQRRRRRTGRQGALLAITVFEAERIAAQVGSVGLDEAWMTIASRIQRQVGVVNPVGRYWDRCFVALVETIPSSSWLRTLGLRVATSLRQPMEVTGRAAEPAWIRLEVGVGVVALPPFRDEPEDMLDEAQRLAEAARHMASRAATRDPSTGAIVPVEAAPLEPVRRPGPFAGRRRILPLQRSAR